jgi:hypothetical protein
LLKWRAKDVVITEEVVNAAAVNDLFYLIDTPLLLDRPGLFPIVGQPTLKAAEAAKAKAEAEKAAMEKAAAAQVEIELWEL